MARHKPTTVDTPLTVLTVNGVAFAAGLVWRPLKSARNYKAEARALGKADKRPLAVIRHGRTVTQAGFAKREKRNYKGIYSLAAALAGVLGEDWIAVFDVGDERYALIAARRGGILPGRDIVGSQDVIAGILRETYNEMSAESDGVNTRVIAPPIFEFGDDVTTLAELLHSRDLLPDYKLRQIVFGVSTGEALIAGAVLLAVAAGVYGYSLWNANQLRIKAASDAQIAGQLVAASNPDLEVIKPWVSQPAAMTVLDACTAYWESVPVSIAGWRFTAGQCGPNGASRTYSRDGSNVEAFARALAQAAVPAYSDAFSTATLSDPIQLPAEVGDVLPAQAQREQAMTAYFQRIDGFASAVIALKPLPPPVDGKPVPVPDWTTYTITVTSAVQPELLFADLDLAGLRVHDIAVTLGENATISWTTTGEFYAQ
jgi:hypothetical protein